MKPSDEKWLAVLRALVSGHHSKARQLWGRLNQNQRGLILHAAGLKAFYCRYKWEQFNDRELLQIKRGIQRLKCITDMFCGLGALAFKQEKKTPIPSGCNAVQRQEIAESQISELIKARQQLRENAANRSH